MPTIYFTCLYCDHKWQDYKYSSNEIEETVCPICKDTALKISKEPAKVNTDPFGYNKE